MVAVGKIVRRLRRTELPSIPYIAEYMVGQGNAWQSSMTISKYPGLLLYHLVDLPNGQTKIFTYWASREHFHRDGVVLQRDIGANSTTFEGFVSALTVPVEPLLKRVPWYTIVLGVAAFLGALQAIGNQFDWIFASPQLTFRVDKPRIHLIEGSEFQESISLLNHLTIAHRHVMVSAALVSDSDRNIHLKLSPAPAKLASLSGGASQEVIVSGTAPKAGAYKLVLKAQALAGVIRSSDTFLSNEPVTVWPRVPSGGLTLKRIQGEIALFSGSIAVGSAAPNGFDCELEIKGIRGLKYDGWLDFPGLSEVARWRMTDSPGNEVASLRWAVLPVTDNHRLLSLQVGLQRTTALDWNRVVSLSTITCQYR